MPTKGAGYLEGAYEYNIWYNKYLGDHWTSQKDREPAETRVDLARDAGHTKADRHDNNLKFFCLYFARGCCAHGKDCQFAHRIPVNADIKRLALDETKDIFGRERHREHRDDMGGVGAIMKPCRTLYAGGLTKTDYKDPRALEECLWRHFGDFGEIENINLIARLSIAFVRYRYRSAAEFAKEAMSNQKLDAEENINVRWAYDDPNPVAEAAAARADADAMVKLLQAKGVDFGKGDVALQAYPADYAMPAAKKARLENGEEVEVAREQLYPNTDTQFGGAAGAAGAADRTDPATGATYLYDAATGAARWRRRAMARATPRRPRGARADRERAADRRDCGRARPRAARGRRPRRALHAALPRGCAGRRRSRRTRAAAIRGVSCPERAKTADSPKDAAPTNRTGNAWAQQGIPGRAAVIESCASRAADRHRLPTAGARRSCRSGELRPPPSRVIGWQSLTVTRTRPPRRSQRGHGCHQAGISPYRPHCPLSLFRVT